MFSPEQLSFLRDKLVAYKGLGDNQKSREREQFLKSAAEEFKGRFRYGDNPGPIFQDMPHYKEVCSFVTSFSCLRDFISIRNFHAGSTTHLDISTKTRQL